MLVEVKQVDAQYATDVIILTLMGGSGGGQWRDAWTERQKDEEMEGQKVAEGQKDREMAKTAG